MKIQIILAMLILAVSVSALENSILIDRETFADYNNFTGLYNSPKWYCSNPPNCYTTTGSGFASITISEDAGNKRLSMVASGFVPFTSTAYIQLAYNATGQGMTGIGEEYYTLFMRMSQSVTHIADANLFYIRSVVGESYYDFSGATHSAYNPIYGAFTNAFVTGGYHNGTFPNKEYFSRLRYYFAPAYNLPRAYPDNPSCGNISTEFYYVAKVYKFINGDLNETKIYKNGVNCEQMDTYSAILSAGDYPFGQLEFKVDNNGAMSIDEFRIYYSTTEPTELAEFPELDTTCTDWTLPYYLLEEFNGYLHLCDWLLSENIYADSQLYLSNQSYFYMQKQTDLAEASKTRYVTLKFDQKIQNVYAYSTITHRLYDDDDNNIFSVFFRDSGNDLWYVEEGTSKIAYQNITMDTWYEYMFVIDLQQNTFDIYVDGDRKIQNAGLRLAMYNTDNVQHYKYVSDNAILYMDNLMLYASDADGVILMPDDGLLPSPADNNTRMCGLFYRNTIPCSTDADCPTGMCMPNGKCNSFDTNYCTSIGRPMGSYCIMSGILSCVLTTTQQMIFDNFLLFLVLLIILMGVVYLVIMFTR